MKIVIASDSHGHWDRLHDIVEQNLDMDAFIFLGDGDRDIEKIQDIYPNLKIYIVQGNCDRTSYNPCDAITGFNNKLVFYTHGSNYGVKTGLMQLTKKAKDMQADIALFGHLHNKCHHIIDGIHVFNPGSVSLNRNQPTASYGILNIQNDEIEFKHIDIE